MTDKEKTIESTDKENNAVKVLIKSPSAQEYRDSQIAYNKAFRKALDSGGLLRQKLEDYMKEQGIWNEEKQKENDKHLEEINGMTETLKKGGIRLSEAKEIALELRTKRAEYRDFLSERNLMDQNSAEGQADNARFSELVRLCMLNPDNRLPFFSSQADYDASADQPWVVEAASELASMIYGLDPDYDSRLEENRFLKEFNFIDEDLRLVNKEGHLTDSEGRLINKEGRFISYRTEEGKVKQDPEDLYFEEGEPTDEWVKASLKDREPFLDDSGKPISSNKKKDKEETPSAKPKRKRKSTKTETDAETA